MNVEANHLDPFAHPTVGRVLPLRLRIARAIAISLCGISVYTVIAGLMTSLFVGSTIGIVISLVWAIPAAGFAYLEGLFHSPMASVSGTGSGCTRPVPVPHPEAKWA